MQETKADRITAANQGEGLLTALETAAVLKVPLSFLYAPVRRRGANAIPSIRMGKYLRYRLSEVMAWVEQQRAEA